MKQVALKNKSGKTHLLGAEVFSTITLTLCGLSYTPQEVEKFSSTEVPTCKKCRKKWVVTQQK